MCQVASGSVLIDAEAIFIIPGEGLEPAALLFFFFFLFCPALLKVHGSVPTEEKKKEGGLVVPRRVRDLPPLRAAISSDGSRFEATQRRWL